MVGVSRPKGWLGKFRRYNEKKSSQKESMNYQLPKSETFGSSMFIHGDALSSLDKIDDGSVSLVISSPPYNIGKAYERGRRPSMVEYVASHAAIIDKLVSKLSEDGSICWQVGNHVKDGEVFPLDYFFYPLFVERGLKLRNRIIWRFNFGLNAEKRFSGRYETLLWFTKSDGYKFNLDPVRVPQKYPGKRHSKQKGARAGLPSGNPLGKNPSDIWEFSSVQAFEDDLFWELPNVKANHPEKTMHPCQFPSELAERCVLAFTNPGDKVLDPFVGAGTSVVAAVKHGRGGIGIDRDASYIELAQSRVDAFRRGDLVLRPMGKKVHEPNGKERVSKVPFEWLERG